MSPCCWEPWSEPRCVGLYPSTWFWESNPCLHYLTFRFFYYNYLLDLISHRFATCKLFKMQQPGRKKRSVHHTCTGLPIQLPLSLFCTIHFKISLLVSKSLNGMAPYLFMWVFSILTVLNSTNQTEIPRSRLKSRCDKAFFQWWTFVGICIFLSCAALWSTEIVF